MSGAVVCDQVGHSYGTRVALDAVTLEVPRGSLFALLGPNGGGKSTLFRILATLFRPTRGRATGLGHDVANQASGVRRAIGVAFQAPALDKKLTVRENLTHQGHLYGLRGRRLAARIDELLALFRLGERARDRVETLSGGLARRVDLAKALLHAPPVLLLDEPSTGLDPGARRELLETLTSLRDGGTTVLLTTHLTDEAARASHVAILDRGKLVVLGAPDSLVAEIGGDVVTLDSEDAPGLAREIGARWGTRATTEGGVVRLEHARAADLLPELLQTFGDRVRSAKVSHPTLEDVFFHRTGRTFSPDGTDRDA
ncbi:MAG: ATP-binding cassette domain-containing protein [Candidatus Eiseniibacteriota bacterium]